MEEPQWRPITVEGVEYHWTTFSTTGRLGKERDVPIERLTVARKPNSMGIDASFAPGTVVTEQHAIEFVRLMQRTGRVIP
jgi:hypothetical protein